MDFSSKTYKLHKIEYVAYVLSRFTVMDNTIKIIEDEVTMLKNKLIIAEENLKIHTNRMKKVNLVKAMLDRFDIMSVVIDYDIIILISKIEVMREQYEAKLIVSFAKTTACETYLSSEYKNASTMASYVIKDNNGLPLLKRIKSAEDLRTAIKNFTTNIAIYIAHVSALDRNLACTSHQAKYRSKFVDPTESYVS